MGFGDAISTCFSKYVTFDGRAARPEYWYWVLFSLLAQLVLVIVDTLVLHSEIGILGVLFSLAVFLPSLAVAVRRLHDLDRSGWWILLAFIPVVGAIILIVWACMPGTPGPNRFGLPPQ